FFQIAQRKGERRCTITSILRIMLEASIPYAEDRDPEMEPSLQPSQLQPGSPEKREEERKSIHFITCHLNQPDCQGVNNVQPGYKSMKNLLLPPPTPTLQLPFVMGVLASREAG
ncbi:hypothetical protein H1C71_010494, partial [Ictidomys tridecemlineatus]